MLKKKYRQMLQERDARRPRADVDARRPASPATAAWDVTDKPAVSSGPADAAAEVTSMLARAASTKSREHGGRRGLRYSCAVFPPTQRWLC